MMAAKDVPVTTLAQFIRTHAEAGSEIHTDEFTAYGWLDASEYKYKSVKHADEYETFDGVTTNGVENVWSLSKRDIIGAFHKRCPQSISLCIWTSRDPVQQPRRVQPHGSRLEGVLLSNRPLYRLNEYVGIEEVVRESAAQGFP